MIGLELSDLAIDGCITKAPCGGEVVGRSPVDRGKHGLKRSMITDLRSRTLRWRCGCCPRRREGMSRQVQGPKSDELKFPPVPTDMAGRRMPPAEDGRRRRPPAGPALSS
jgi:hypothetical protein